MFIVNPLSLSAFSFSANYGKVDTFVFFITAQILPSKASSVPFRNIRLAIKLVTGGTT